MLHSDDIFKKVLNSIYELEMGELEIPILTENTKKSH